MKYLATALAIIGALDHPLRAADAPASAPLKAESFDRDPGWEGSNNRIVPAKPLIVTQEFGYSPTHFAGAAPGEMGGRIQRSTTPASYAAALVPAVTLEEKLTASGRFAITASQPGAGVFFGFFHSQQPGGSGRPIGSLGLHMDFEGSGGRLAVRLITSANKSCGTFVTPYLPGKFRPTPLKIDGTQYAWTLAYDPAAGGGNGRFTFTIGSDSHTREDYGPLNAAARQEADARFPATTTFTVDLPAGYKAEGATFDRFGAINMMKSGGAVTLFFDDLRYGSEVQDFSEDPAWIGAGNRVTFEDREQVGAHDFGFSPATSHAGGAPGEVGGGLWRSGLLGYYADRVGPLTLAQRLEARGRVRLVTAGPDSDMFLGWFNSGGRGTDPASNFVAIHVGGPTRVGHYFIPVFATAHGSKGKVDQGPVLTPGKMFDWSLIYDPSAGNGDGEMRVTLGAESVTLALKPGQKTEGAHLDRFGLFTSTAGGQMVKIFLDDLEYTASIAPGTPTAAPAPSHPPARVLDGHTGSVLGLEFSPDGSRLVGSSRDGTLTIRDARTGALLQTLTDHTADVYAVRFSPGGDLLASCSGDRTIRLRDARTFKTITVLEGHTDVVRAVAFSPDGRSIASVSLDQTVRLWEVATGRLQKTLSGHTARVKSVDWSPDGKTIATASSDRTIRLWDARTGAAKRVLEGHAGDLETLVYSPDGRLLASSSGDTTVRLWDAEAGNHVRTLSGHTAEVDSVAFSPDGITVASGSKDTIIILWDVRTGDRIRTLRGHTGRVESMAFSPDGATLATGGGGGDTSVRLWPVSDRGN